MENFEQKVTQLAELVVRVGVNVQPGQLVVIDAPIESKDFVRKIVAAAYDTGAKFVSVLWGDEQTSRIRFDRAPEESFTFYPNWRASVFAEIEAEQGAFIVVYAPNPELLHGVDPKRVSDSGKAASQVLSQANEGMRNHRFSWTMVNAPTPSWADKVFADAPEGERLEKMWESIFQINHLNEGPDPISTWKHHLELLESRAERLNQKRYKKLHYRSALTDLSVELPEGHVWIGGATRNRGGVLFNANMPTEEVFTMPHKEGVNGVLRSTMPLNYGGTIITNISVQFEKGRIVNYSADTGYETLKNLIETDEGSHRLGEIALVPYESPISLLNRVFYNTLIDENASCHVAIGNAYPLNLNGGRQMTNEELDQAGANSSLTHVDFMIGSADLNITGELPDGSTESVFVNGNWAF